MTRQFYHYVCTLMSLLVLGGCSLILDPTTCTSDSDCNSGVCTSGVCIEPREDPADASVEDSGENPPDVTMTVEMDSSLPDAFLTDADTARDVMVPVVDQMLTDEPPTCFISAESELTGESEVRLTIRVTDPDSDVSDLEVIINGSPLNLDQQGEYIGIFLLGPDLNEFQLLAETNGKTCAASVTVVSDRTAPKLENPQPEIGSIIKSGNGRIFVTADVVEAHFARDIQIFVDSTLTEPSSPVEWTNQSYFFELQLDRGIHNVEVLITDQVGNQLPSPTGRDCSIDSCLHSFTVDVDSIPPTIEFDSLSVDAPNRIPGQSVRLLGTILDEDIPLAMAFMSVTVRPEMGAERIFSMQTDALGRFDQSVDVLDPLSNQATVEVCATDISGNQGCENIVIEKQLPCIDILVPTANSIFSASSVAISGTICDGVDRIEFQRNGQPVRFIAVSGSTTFASNVSLPENGEHHIRAIAFNDVLGETAEAVVTVSRDTTNPLLTFTRPINANSSSPVCTRSNLETCVAVSDPESGISTLTLGNLDIPTNQIGATVCRTLEVPTGANVEVTAQARNGSGLITEASIRLNVDNRAPFVSFTKPTSTLPNPWVKTQAGLVSIEGTVDSGVCATQSFSLNEIPLNIQQDNTFSVILPFGQGQQTVTYNVMDLAGNERSSSFPFRVDDTAPTIEVTGITPGQHLGTQRAEFSVFVTDTESRIDPDSLSVNNSPAVLVAAGANRFMADVSVDLAEGDNVIEIAVADRVGNSASTTINIIRDTLPPVITTLTPTSNQAIAIPTIVRGTVTDGETGIGVLSIFVNDVEAIIDLEAGTWYAAGIEVDPVERSIEIYGSDQLANQSQPEIINVRMPDYALVDPMESGINALLRTPSAIHTGDFNADDRIDILELSDDVNAPSRCLIQREDASFEVRSAEVCGIPEITDYQCSRVADFDGDSHLDILYFSGAASEILFGDASGSFTSDNINLVVDQSITGCEVIDIDRDGRLDVLALTEDMTYVLFGDESLDFQLDDPALLFLNALSDYQKLKAVDINDDGFTDLIGYGANGMTILTGSIGGAFQEMAVVDELPHAGSNEREVVVMDANADGAFEIILLGQTTKVFTRDKTSAEPQLFSKQSGMIDTFANQSTAERADVNGDGRDDFLVFGAFGVKVIANFGSELSQIDEAPLGLSGVGNVQLVNIVDLDGDGDEDWVLGTSTGLKIWKSNLVQRNPSYAFFKVVIKKFTLSEPTFRPSDSHGTHLFVEYLDQAALDGAGQVLSLDPTRAMLPRQNVPTVVSLGAHPGAHVSVRYVDRGTLGRSLRTVDRISNGQTRVFHARE